jgi:hypothetical protein
MEKELLIMVLVLSAQSGVVLAWTPPIGIPPPQFGIEETVQSLHGDPLYRTKTISGGGDLAGKMPALAAGDVLVIESGNYTLTRAAVWDHRGTSAGPIIVRGISPENRPIIRMTQSADSLGFAGSYVIYENLDFDLGGIEAGLYTQGDHISFRNCDVHGAEGTTNTAFYVGGTYNVVYNNSIHDNGPLDGSGDPDFHGLGASDHHNWIVDNEIYRNGGDGIQINAGDASVARSTHHIYVGRNDAWGNRQSGFWIKFCEDIILSENKAHGHRSSESSSGQGMGFQYGTERAWFIYNDIYDNEEGITIGSDGGPGGDGNGKDSYFVGNIIHGIQRQGLLSWETSSRKHAVNNIIYDADKGIDFFNAVAGTEVQNNLFASIASTDIDLDSNKGGIFAYNLCDEGCEMVDATCSDCCTGDPHFMDADGADNRAGTADDNFALMNSSAAIDKGTVSGVYKTFQDTYNLSIAVDPTRSLRPQGSAWDIGAFEYASGSACVPAQEICGNGIDEDCDGSDLSCICVHAADDDPCNGCISISELQDYVGQWRAGSVQLNSMMETIRIWKEGCT